MKTKINESLVKDVHLIYGVFLKPEELTEETTLINDRVDWEGETKTALEIAHQYASQRAAYDFWGLF